MSKKSKLKNQCAVYQHVSYTKMLESMKQNKEDTDMPAPNNTNTNTKRRTPEVPESAKQICALFQARMEQFLADARITTVDKNMARELFNLGTMPLELSTIDPNLSHYKLYILDRNAQFNYAGPDDKVGTFRRASMFAVVLNADNIPTYFVDSFVNNQLISGIRVIPLDKHGPKYINQARWNTASANNAG